MRHPMRRTTLSATLLAAAVAACTGTAPDADLADRAAPGPIRSYAASPALAADSRVAPTVVWDDAAGRPRLVAGAFPVATAASPEAAARQFLRRHADRFQLATDGSDLALTATRTGLAGTYLRFGQRTGGLPVFDREVIVLVSADAREVRAANLAHEAGLITPPAIDVVGASAIDLARAHVGAPPEQLAPTAIKGWLTPTKKGAPARLAYRVTIAAADPEATWQVMIDATTGEVISAHDRNRRADGTGLVFDMSPVASTGNTALPDSNDANSAALDAARFAVTLPRLDGSGVLRGTWVDAQARTVANRAQSASLAFAYDRNDDRFEEVMLYYHLDRAQARIQALGFTNVNNRVQVAVANADNQDNSFYSPSNKQVRFGAGGVDDAEDADIILHEYGHSIQDNQVPGWGAPNSDADAMGEGFGDYLAASFGAVLPAAAGHAQPADPACVGDWDAVSYDNGTPPCLRRVDGTGHYPERAVGQVHSDGELWSAGLWRARTAVGADVMDTLIFEGHFLMSVAESFDGASNAVLIADQMINGGANRLPVRRALYHQGLLRTVLTPAFYSDATPETVDVRNPVGAGGQYANRLDDTQTITRPGAQALRVRFATLDTQTSSQCFGGGCDNVYLYDGNGDLYQILNGSQNGVVSVQVPGDTIRVRLVTDGSTTRTGYVIDRVDVMGGAVAIDAAQPIDAPAPPVDATVPAIDAAVPTIDAAVPVDPVDAAVPVDPVDAGEDVDASPPAADGDETGGCGCRTGEGGVAAPALSLGVLALLLRRRRRA